MVIYTRKVCILLIRIVPVLGAEHVVLAGEGGASKRPRITRFLGNVDKKRKKLLESPRKTIKKLFQYFFRLGQHSGHQRSPKLKMSKFPYCMTTLHIIRIISVPIRATIKFKDTLESSRNALFAKSPQTSPKVNRLGVRGHERTNVPFLAKPFLDNFRVAKDRAILILRLPCNNNTPCSSKKIILTPSCLPREGASNNVYDDLGKSNSKFDLRSMLHGDLRRSNCISLDVS